MRDDEAIDFAVAELTRLIEIPSYSDDERAVMDVLASRCSAFDLPVRTQEVPGAGPNLVVGWFDEPTLLLTAHMDTIVPTWRTDHRASVDGTVVRGLGAQDDKGCAVAILLAMLLARENVPAIDRLPVALGFCVDEEVQGKGSKLMADVMRPPFVVASEGTELDVAIVETGFVEGWARIPGRSRHGAVIEEAENPLVTFAGLAKELLDAGFTASEHPVAGRNLVTLLRFEAEHRTNATPPAASAYLVARIFGEPDLEHVAKELVEICERHGATFEEDGRGGWWETDWDAPLVRALRTASEQAIGYVPSPARMPAWTDAHSFHDRSDSQVVVYGPGHLRAAHRPDEWIDAAELVRSAKVMARLIGAAGELADAAPAARRGGATR